MLNALSSERPLLLECGKAALPQVLERAGLDWGTSGGARGMVRTEGPPGLARARLELRPLSYLLVFASSVNRTRAGDMRTQCQVSSYCQVPSETHGWKVQQAAATLG